jgi:hypothetical protein
MKEASMRCSSSLMAFLLAAPAALAAAPAADLPSLLERLPADVSSVMVVRWSELRASSLYRLCEERVGFERDDLDFEEVVRVTGVDPESVDLAVLALRGRQKPLGFVVGQFDRSRILAALTAAGVLPPGTDPDRSTYELAPHERPAAGVSLSFLTPRVLVFGDAGTVAAVAAEAPPQPGGEMSARLLEARHEGQVWGVVTLDGLAPALGRLQPSEALAPLASLSWLSFDLDFGRELELALTGDCASAEQAEQARQALLGWIALAQLGARDDVMLQGALAETSVERTGTTIVLRSRLAREVLERAFAVSGQAGDEAAGARQR